MLGVIAALPDRDSARPPIILVHGAANSASIWTFWQQELAAQGRASEERFMVCRLRYQSNPYPLPSPCRRGRRMRAGN